MTSQELIDIIDSTFEAEPYRGRGTDGLRVVAIKTDGSEWQQACFREMKGLPSYLYDRLGKGYVYYFPDYEWPEEAVVQP